MDDIIKIPITGNPPSWNSSPPPPIQQLNKIGSMGLVDGFRDYNRCTALTRFLAGKRIAYVCPSPHLKGLGMGRFIDSHDLVVRVNLAYHQPEDDWKDYGRRTDIVMNCLNIHKRKALYNNISFTNSLKFIICPMVNAHTLPVVEFFLSQLRIPTHNVCDGYLYKIFEQVGTTCNTGLTGIITLLNYDIKSIYLTGMTFFNMNKFGNIYNDTYHDEAAKNNNFKSTSNKQPAISDLGIDIHQQQPQIDYFKKILKYHYPDRLKIDDYLQKNFKKTLDE